MLVLVLIDRYIMIMHNGWTWWRGENNVSKDTFTYGIEKTVTAKIILCNGLKPHFITEYTETKQL